MLINCQSPPDVIHYGIAGLDQLQRCSAAPGDQVVNYSQERLTVELHDVECRLCQKTADRMFRLTLTVQRLFKWWNIQKWLFRIIIWKTFEKGRSSNNTWTFNSWTDHGIQIKRSPSINFLSVGNLLIITCPNEHFQHFPSTYCLGANIWLAR